MINSLIHENIHVCLPPTAAAIFLSISKSRPPRLSNVLRSLAHRFSRFLRTRHLGNDSAIEWTNKMHKLMNLRPVTNYINFSLTLKLRSPIHFKARSHSSKTKIVQFAIFLPKRAEHEDFRLRKPWKFQLSQNKALELGVVGGKLAIQHKRVNRTWNKAIRNTFVEFTERNETSIFRIKIGNLDEKSIRAPRTKSYTVSKTLNLKSHFPQNCIRIHGRFWLTGIRSG